MFENNRDKISIIVAVYNTENYLHKCINSIINQTHKNLEIILVDDGSTDACTQICDEYQKRDNRIRVIHKTNGGQGSARNLALETATGDWIGFVDSDDWIANDMYEYLLHVAKKEDANIVECGWYKINENGIIDFETEDKYYSLTNEEAMQSLVYAGDGINTSVCNKLFKKECIGTYRFPEVRAYEDDEWIHKVIWSVSKILVTSSPKYYYFNRTNSTITSTFNLNKIALLTVQKNICDFLSENAPLYFNKAQKTLCSKQFYIISCLLKNPELDKDHIIIKQIEQEILNLYISYMRNPEMSRNRLILFLYRFFPSLAKFAIKIKF